MGTNLGTHSTEGNFGVGNLLETMVGRDGIEPPTPGFSVLFSRSWKCAYMLAVESRSHDGIVRWSAQE